MTKTSMQDYLDESARTYKPLDEVRTDVFATHTDWLFDLTMLVEAGCQADLIKRSVFYKEEIDKTRARGAGYSITNKKLYDALKVAQLMEKNMAPEERLTLTTQKIDIIHAALGMISEAGEIIEEVISSTVNHRELDLVNLKEEGGDELWYNALYLRSIGSDFETEAKNNIEKLQKRYPLDFNTDAALNRDLEGERALLEKQSA